MSYLLDAVGREKQQQGRLDPALAAPLAPKRALPWHIGWPLVGAAVGAGLSWLALSLQPQPEPAAPVVTELAVIKQVTMPIPVAWEPADAPETQYVYTPDTANIAPEEVAASPVREAGPESASSGGASSPAAADAQPAARTEPVDGKAAQQPANAKLLAAFERAVADLDLEPQVASPATVEPEPEPELSAESLLNPQSPPATEVAEAPKLDSLPVTFQKRLPDINITAHVYSSDADNRWLRANGRELQEGDAVAPGVTVREIRPNEVILEMSGQAFSVPALGQL